MIPLMTPEQHLNFQRLKAEMDTKFTNLAQVFVPVAPEKNEDIPFKALFIGQATGHGWGDENLAHYENAAGKANCTVSECTAGRTPGFWRVVEDIVSGAYVKLKLPAPSDFDQVIGWSNLAKIAKTNANPKGGALLYQATACSQQLLNEINLMNPTIVILITGDFAEQQIVFPTFGKEGWQHASPKNNEGDAVLEDCVAFKEFLGAPVIWMNHPRKPGKPGYRKFSIEFVISKIIEALDAAT